LAVIIVHCCFKCKVIQHNLTANPRQDFYNTLATSLELHEIPI
jgi:hypothetical protein